MPCVNSFFGKKLSLGARAAAIYTIIMVFPMFGVGYLRMKDLREESGPRNPYLDGYSEKSDRESKFKSQMAVSYFAFGVLFLIMSVCLLVGTSNKNPRYVWPWIIIVGMAMGYLLVRLVYHGFIAPIIPVGEAIIGLIALFIGFYFYLIVYSFKQECVDRLLAALQEALRQQSMALSNQQYIPLPTSPPAKDLPPPYYSSSSHPPPPPYSSSIYAPQQLAPVYTVTSFPSSPPVTGVTASAPPTTNPPPSPFTTHQYGGYPVYPPSSIGTGSAPPMTDPPIYPPPPVDLTASAPPVMNPPPYTTPYNDLTANAPPSITLPPHPPSSNNTETVNPPPYPPASDYTFK